MIENIDFEALVSFSNTKIFVEQNFLAKIKLKF